MAQIIVLYVWISLPYHIKVHTRNFVGELGEVENPFAAIFWKGDGALPFVPRLDPCADLLFEVQEAEGIGAHSTLLQLAEEIHALTQSLGFCFFFWHLRSGWRWALGGLVEIIRLIKTIDDMS